MTLNKVVWEENLSNNLRYKYFFWTLKALKGFKIFQSGRLHSEGLKLISWSQRKIEEEEEENINLIKIEM